MQRSQKHEFPASVDMFGGQALEIYDSIWKAKKSVHVTVDRMRNEKLKYDRLCNIEASVIRPP